jgi:hypothetical protein
MGNEVNKFLIGASGSVLAVSAQGVSQVLSIAASMFTIVYMGLWIYKTVKELKK